MNQTEMKTNPPKPTPVDILILGAGWTSTFLIPLLEREKVSYAATTTTGREGTYKFKFEHLIENTVNSEENLAPYASLPHAKTVLITFPIRGKCAFMQLHTNYAQSHNSQAAAHFILLGSTSIYSVPRQECWVNRRSKYDVENTRAVAEDEALLLRACVLNLAGLWGGERHPRHWIKKVAPTKEALQAKTSLHLIHGADVSRAVLAIHRDPGPSAGERFILTDLVVYDWWELALGLRLGDGENSLASWVKTLMCEKELRALPRPPQQLGRCLDSRDFWDTYGIMPIASVELINALVSTERNGKEIE